MGGPVFPYAEGIVRPDKDHRRFHQCGYPDRGFHIVGEDEEGTTGRDHTAMETHPYGEARHGELGNACLEEGSGEIIPGKRLRILQETIGFIGIR